MLIRQIKHQDLSELKTFAEYTFRAAWQAENQTAEFEQYCADSFTPESLRNEIDDPVSAFYFAELNDQTVGYLKLNRGVMPPNWSFLPEQTLQIERIYIDPKQQSKGFGTSLLHFAEFVARDENRPHIWLSVWQEAPRSIRFYELNGYQICGTDDFWLDTERQTDWVMAKFLDVDQPPLVLRHHQTEDLRRKTSDVRS